MNKFQVGDKVERINFSYNGLETGNVGIVVSIPDIHGHLIELNSGTGFFSSENFKLVEQPVPELKERYLVKFRNGEEAMVDTNRFRKIKAGIFSRGAESIIYYIGDLDKKTLIETRIKNGERDIVEVFKPEYKKIWERTEDNEPECTEYTIKQLEEKLGHKIKIKGE